MIRTVVLGLMLALGALSARAQDGLQRFEKDIKPNLEFKSLTYDKAAALGDKGFVLEGVTAVMPPSDAPGSKDATVKVDRITVEELDFERVDARKDTVPRFARIKLEGMTGDDDISSLLTDFGIPKAPVDLALDYRIDPDAKVLTLNKLEIGLRGQAVVTLSLVLEGVSDKASDVPGAKDNSRLRTGSLVINDTGLLLQLLPAIAKQQGAPPEALIALVVMPVAGFAQAQGPDTVKSLDALVSFVADWKKPAGPIRISITPAKSASMADLEKLDQPNALSDIFGLKVDYAGTRPGASTGGK